MFDDYMKFLAGTCKQEQEALKQAGLILCYSVLTVEPRTPTDPDVVLTRYTNRAALDGVTENSAAVSASSYGSAAQADAGAIGRTRVRAVIDSTTMQEVVLQ